MANEKLKALIESDELLPLERVTVMTKTPEGDEPGFISIKAIIDGEKYGFFEEFTGEMTEDRGIKFIRDSKPILIAAAQQDHGLLPKEAR